METINIGIIGCGLMGRELASAAARWCHLPKMGVRPQIVAVCDTNPALFGWYKDNFPSIRLATGDHRELLADKSVQAVYCAVPHSLHRQLYCDAISAGKHLMAEKPFGMDKAACAAILTCMKKHPGVFVRCSSEFPFFPAVQQIGKMIEAGAFGRIIEFEGGFLHSSDLDPTKPINWKRQVKLCGEYGVMGDLGMHVCHVPFRAGWRPRNVRAVLSKIVAERPDGKGQLVPCDTWDNATLLCEAAGGDSATFPMTLKTQRIAPGQKNTWYVSILGTRACARFSTKDPKRLEVLEYSCGKQEWRQIDMGQEAAFASITGGIFEFGFSDAVLQMWAAFLQELCEFGAVACRDACGRPRPDGAGPEQGLHQTPAQATAPARGRFTTCVTPQEAALSHELFTAALESNRSGAAREIIAAPS